MKKNESYIRVYKSLALQTFNTIVLILLLNLILAGLLWVRDTFLKSMPAVDQRVLSHREKYSDLKAYTVMKPVDVNRFLNEQDSMGSIGFQHEAWVQFRNPEFHGTFLNTDERGFRKTKDPQFSSGRPIKIYVFGGSATFGYGVADDNTIPSFIQTILERQYPDYSILVKNYGQGFYYSSQEMLLLISLIKDNDIPDFAIFIDGGNDTHQLHLKHDQPYFTNTLRDLWNFRRHVSYSQPKRDYSWIPMIRLAKGISRRLLALKSHKESRNPNKEKQINNLSPGTNEECSNADYVVKRYKNNIRIIRSICCEYGIKCYFVWQPMPFYKYDRSLHRTFPYPGQIPKHWSEVYTGMKDYSSLDFLYLGEFFENVFEKVFVDDVHYNEKYNEKIAAEICELLKSDLNDFASPNSESNLKFTETKMKIFGEEEIRWKLKKAFDIAVGTGQTYVRCGSN